ncbi:ATPase/DNA packaging protein [Helicobacter sp. 23-1045]
MCLFFSSIIPPMKTKERLIIKNFGPIVKATIDIKPFMVFIGESGSGKSVILKLLSLFRWIYKQQQFFYLMEIFTKSKLDFETHINKILSVEIENAGLLDYFQKGCLANYEINDIIFVIGYDAQPNFALSSKRTSKTISLEKIAFITDERLIIPTLLNNKSRNIIFPYHLTSTYEDFRFAFDKLKNGNKQIAIQTMGVNLNSEKSAYEEKIFVSQDNASYKISLQDSSSGIKSVAVVEVISNFYSFYFGEKDIIANFFLKVVPNNFANLVDLSFDNIKPSATPEEFMGSFVQNITSSFAEIKSLSTRISIFIEEPELNLFPNAQKALVEHLVHSCFEPPKQDKSKSIHIAFSTHSPYMLSSLNCLLLAHEIVAKNPNLKDKVESIIPSKFWIDISKFDAFKVENGEVFSIVDKETNLILAENIDEVSEEIGESFDKLLELDSK